eukprot:1132965-Prymnesium_polylepis.1
MRVVPQLRGNPQLAARHLARADRGVQRAAHRRLVAIHRRAVDVPHACRQRSSHGGTRRAG